MTARVASLLRAAKAREDTPPSAATLDEEHYTAEQLAKRWNLDESTIRRMFAREPGVVRLKRALRIPKSVAERKYSGMLVV